MADLKNEKTGSLSTLERGLNSLLSVAEKITKITLPAKEIVRSFEKTPASIPATEKPADVTSASAGSISPIILLLGFGIVAYLFLKE